MGRARRGRVTSANANRRLPLNETYIPNSYDLARQLTFGFLRSIEDRRTWHPEGPQRPARTLSRARQRFTLVEPLKRNQKRTPAYSGVNATVAFAAPESVAVCVRRQQRKEVLHARKKTGRGKGRQKRPRRSWYSSISCRRNRR